MVIQIQAEPRRTMYKGGKHPVTASSTPPLCTILPSKNHDPSSTAPKTSILHATLKKPWSQSFPKCLLRCTPIKANGIISRFGRDTRRTFLGQGLWGFFVCVDLMRPRGCPSIWLYVIQGLSVREFLDEIHIWLGDRVKQLLTSVCVPQIIWGAEQN